MFSGIVEESATVVVLDATVEPARLIVGSGLDHSKTQLGDSVAISGVCLTVVKNVAGELSFDLALETLRRSTLGSLKAGDRVNLERSLVLGDRLHGHFVFGHVDTVSKLLAYDFDGKCARLKFELPQSYVGFVVPKGSISISGVSLTVGEVEPEYFTVYIVPHTAEVTTLSQLKVGDSVNVEVDMLARYVHSMLQGQGSR